MVREAEGVARLAFGDGPTGMRGHVEIVVRRVEEAGHTSVSWGALAPEDASVVRLLKELIEAYVPAVPGGLHIDVKFVGSDPVCRNDNLRAAELALRSALDALGLPPLPLYSDPRTDPTFKPSRGE